MLFEGSAVASYPCLSNCSTHLAVLLELDQPMDYTALDPFSKLEAMLIFIVSDYVKEEMITG